MLSLKKLESKAIQIMDADDVKILSDFEKVVLTLFCAIQTDLKDEIGGELEQVKALYLLELHNHEKGEE